MNDIINIRNKILKIINSNIEDVKIQPEQADEELFLIILDSIKFIQIMVALEDAFEIEIPDEKLLITEMGTLNKMAEVISAILDNKDE